MGEVTRAGTEVLQLHNCPCCGGDVDVVECGYSAFNPGSAYCHGKCGRKWNLSYVDDAWDAGQKWNDRAHEIAMKLAALELLEIKSCKDPGVEVTAGLLLTGLRQDIIGEEPIYVGDEHA